MPDFLFESNAKWRDLEVPTSIPRCKYAASFRRISYEKRLSLEEDGEGVYTSAFAAASREKGADKRLAVRRPPPES